MVDAVLAAATQQELDLAGVLPRRSPSRGKLAAMTIVLEAGHPLVARLLCSLRNAAWVAASASRGFLRRAAGLFKEI